jgi:hypothetical protein
MRLTKLDRMLLSYCYQTIGKELREGKRKSIPPPCNSVEEFEQWRIRFFDRVMADPDYDPEESLEACFQT